MPRFLCIQPGHQIGQGWFDIDQMIVIVDRNLEAAQVVPAKDAVDLECFHQTEVGDRNFDIFSNGQRQCPKSSGVRILTRIVTSGTDQRIRPSFRNAETFRHNG